MDTTRRDLMTERDAALKAGDIARFHKLTRQIAALPMKGVPELTQKDIDRWNRNKVPTYPVIRGDGRTVMVTVPENDKE